MSYLLELDQIRVEQQQEIACHLYFDGINDGYFKVLKQSGELEYLLGYIEGLGQRCDELENQKLALDEQESDIPF